MSSKQGKTKRKVWYKIVAVAIQTQVTFSVQESKYGSKYIYEEIAHYLLQDCDDTEKCKSFNYYCRRVKNRFDDALTYLESEGVQYYKHRPSSRILYVTIDPEKMPNARQDDFDRLIKHVTQTVTAAKVHVVIAHPRLVQRFNKSAQQLLLSGQGPE